MLTVFRHALMDAVATLARIFHQIAGWWRVNLRADLRIPCQANSHAYWREAGVQRCRKLAANTREGRRYKLDSGLIASKPLFMHFSVMFGAVLVKYPG